jgi:nitrogen fixation NifU-like protein
MGMTAEFDKLEEDIMTVMRSIYTQTVIDHAMSPRNVGNLKDSDGFASVTGPCGDTMEIWLRVKDSKVRQATFWTDGCGTAIAAGSMVTELVRGKAIADALKLTQQDVLDALGGLPEDSVHCALLAANTLKEAVRDYMALRKEPWKRAYRKD